MKFTVFHHNKNFTSPYNTFSDGDASDIRQCYRNQTIAVVPDKNYT